MTSRDDMFLRQMLGRFRAHKLTVQTIINPEIEKIAELDVENIVKRQMAHQLAEEILNTEKLRNITVQNFHPDFLGKPVRMSTYCMNEEEFIKLIIAAYDAGLESAWSIEKNES